MTTDTSKRLFVPLASKPFEWFVSGKKRWELRRYGRQYTTDHIVVGRRVELRRGYSTGQSLWGDISALALAGSIREILTGPVPYAEVIPTATSLEEAIATAHSILGEGEFRVIAFRVDLDEKVAAA